jgi:hypothetical protein
MRALRDLKNEVREAVATRRASALPLPTGAEAWWSDLERHEAKLAPELQEVFRS